MRRIVRLKSFAKSPRFQFAAAVSLLLLAWIASVLHSTSWSPQVPGYRRVHVRNLHHPSDAKSLDGQRVWIIGGVAWGDNYALVAPFNGDHPNYGPFVKLRLPPTSIVRPPQSRDRFNPYGVLHVTRDDDERLRLSLDVVGETESGLVAESTSVFAIALVIGAGCAFASSIVITIKTAYDKQRASRFGPGCCRICGYDLRASPGRCPECGAVCSRGPPAAA